MKKLAIVTTHPIQYYAPVFKMLTERKVIAVKVFYTFGNSLAGTFDQGFGQQLKWDIPLLEGYHWEWVKNVSDHPSTHSFKGIVNPDICEQIDAWSPDAVLVYGWAYSGHLKVLRYFRNKRSVFFKGDSTLMGRMTCMKKMARYILLRWVYSHVDHAFYNGKANKDYFKTFGLSDAQLSFAPHAVDNERFSYPQIKSAGQLRSSLGLQDGDILILYAGKFEKVKNLPLLIKAFGQLKCGNVHLLLAGDGSEQGKLLSLAEACKNRKYIHFTGFKNQSYMPVLYQAADLVCLPSLSETWGLAVNEAMACKKAVLVSNRVGCAADLVFNNFNGKIFKSNDEQDLINCLDELTSSKDKLLQYGIYSEHLIRNWSFTEVAEAIERHLLGFGHKP